MISISDLLATNRMSPATVRLNRIDSIIQSRNRIVFDQFFQDILNGQGFMFQELIIIYFGN